MVGSHPAPARAYNQATCTTIEIDGELLAEVEELAALRGCSATEIIENAVRDKVSSQRPSVRRERVALPVFHGTGLQPFTAGRPAGRRRRYAPG